VRCLSVLCSLHDIRRQHCSIACKEPLIVPLIVRDMQSSDRGCRNNAANCVLLCMCMCVHHLVCVSAVMGVSSNRQSTRTITNQTLPFHVNLPKRIAAKHGMLCCLDAASTFPSGHREWKRCNACNYVSHVR